ncbi:MAG: hypothetical protein ACREEP_16175, partial [Dongiaceae bacterium]
DNTVVDIDIPAGEGGASLADIDKYRSIAISEGAVWIPDVGNSVIYKVDPQSNKVALTIPTFIAGSAGSIGVGAGAIWIVTFDNHDKDADALQPRKRRTGGADCAAPALQGRGGRLWEGLGCRRKQPGIVCRRSYDEQRGFDHSDPRRVPSSGLGVGSIWIGYDMEGPVEGVDDSLGEVMSTIATGVTDMESDGDITVAGGHVWMITRGSTIAQIDPESDELKGLLRPEAGTIAGRRIRYGAGSLWVSGSSILRIAPPK